MRTPVGARDILCHESRPNRQWDPPSYRSWLHGLFIGVRPSGCAVGQPPSPGTPAMCRWPTTLTWHSRYAPLANHPHLALPLCAVGQPPSPGTPAMCRTARCKQKVTLTSLPVLSKFNTYGTQMLICPKPDESNPHSHTLVL